MVLTCTFYYKLTLWITCAIQSLFFFISCQIGLRRNSQKKGVQKYFLGHFCKHFSVDIPWILLLIFYQCSTRHCRIKSYSQSCSKKKKKEGLTCICHNETCYQIMHFHWLQDKKHASHEKIGDVEIGSRNYNKQKIWNGNLCYFVSSFVSNAWYIKELCLTLHLFLFITRKIYAFIWVNWWPIVRRSFMSAKKRKFARNLDSITIVAFLFTFNSIFIYSYASFGIQNRKIYFHLR